MIEIINVDENVSEIFSAMNNAIRQKILTLLYQSMPLKFVDLGKRIGMKFPVDSGKFSHHLRRLKEVNLVKREKGMRYTLTNLGKYLFNGYIKIFKGRNNEEIS